MISLTLKAPEGTVLCGAGASIGAGIFSAKPISNEGSGVYLQQMVPSPEASAEKGCYLPSHR